MKNIYPWQQTLWQHILHLHSAQRLPHAWLITGSEGVGKSDFAEHFAKYLLCQNEDACENCLSCKLFINHQHPDYYRLQDNESGKITLDTVRDLREALQQTAQQNGARVVIINPAEQLTISAANALLKLIEEPPESVYFMLVSTKTFLLLPTLRSRCQTLHCAMPTYEQSSAWLSTQVEKTDSISKALQLSYGAPLYALALLNDPNRMAEYEQCINQFLSIMNKKQSALEVAVEWSKLDEMQVLALVQYCLLRLTRQASGIGDSPRAMSMDYLLKLYQLSLDGCKQLLEIPGLNRQLFWERFLLSV